ncbi:O-antigen ligase family protein [Nitrosococcus watsonii]|uniref:O-antigen polymerase n=1 Tax=Nitrosococcus watsoni (strain C-113) TaxID=105559 RepID=D8KBE5_NITWC|nr:O-antigen ligase family protein [Nitrosococcus watsonii]ADJ29592.1 O-antigen polymerase [Nitrosococcus watsonii C-113]
MVTTTIGKGAVARPDDRSSILKRLYLLALAVFCPMVYPSLPFNTAIVDYINVAFGGLFLLYGVLGRRKPQIRLLFPFTLLVLASLIAMFNSPVLKINILTLVQDIYLFGFFLLLYNLLDSERDMRLLLRIWLLVASLEGGLALANMYGSFWIVPTADPTRANGTFANSNMLASYLGVAFFLNFQRYFDSSLLSRMLSGFLIFGGMFATKSMSAMLGFLLGMMLIMVGYWWRGSGQQRLKLGVGVFMLAAVITVSMPMIMQTENLFERAPKSSEGRLKIWQAGYESFLAHPMGIGAGAFKYIGHGPYNAEGGRSELHSDYMGALVERGILGLLAHLIFLGTIISMALYCLKQAQTEREFFWGIGVGAVVLYILIDSVTHEVMHDRHVWVIFAIIAAEEKLIKRSRARAQA